MTRRKERVEVWNALHFVLAELWQTYGHLFPRSLHLRSRPMKTPRDVVEIAAEFGQEPMVFFSAWLSCGHVVRVPEEVLIIYGSRSRRPARRSLVPCYKCWALQGGGALGTVAIVCSFCGVPHGSSVPCIRPHLER